MSTSKPVSAQNLKTSSEEDLLISSKSIDELTSSLYTSNVTMVVAIILLAGILVMCVTIYVRFRHVPTLANVYAMISDHPGVNYQVPSAKAGAKAALGGVSFW